MQEHRMVIEFRLTRRKVLTLLAVFFICWHPAMLGSETLTLTTYYPAPYGGYARLLTTGETLLARDGGAVGIGTGATALPAGNSLTINGGAIGGTYALRPGYANWANYGTGSGGAAIYNDNNAYRKLMIVGNNSGGGSREVGIWDNLTVAGSISGSCRRVNYGAAGMTSCAAGERIMGNYGDGVVRQWGFLVDDGGNPVGRLGFGRDWRGQMICCRISN
ncbi:MAG: hypothetical protein RQ748_04510 [Elusimicrobiales bacterium]|nr:hypothetical protein [Elusimicrobiales bacterium]